MSQKVLVSESKAAAIEKVKSASRVVPVNPKKNATNSRIGLRLVQFSGLIIFHCSIAFISFKSIKFYVIKSSTSINSN